ncbi:MAG: nitroreductase, partial [Gordonia sp. (in: high G+C Gram-positive bacteria)]
TPVRDAMIARRSYPQVSDAAPTHEELLDLVAAAARVADHKSLGPWRLIELRDDDRLYLAQAIAEVGGVDEPSPKPFRAPLLIAIVSCPRDDAKVPGWEQEAVAIGVGHALNLLLDEAGYGVIWRTGDFVRSPEVADVHGLAPNEKLMGWLYVGGKPDRTLPARPVDAARFLRRLP